MSRTVIKPQPGFRAELPALDLATLIQITCARRDRLVVRVSSYGEEGFLYSADGRLWHATLGKLLGDEAVLRMLTWPTGEFSVCDRPFPLHPTVETSVEGLLLRAAQRLDEAAARDRDTDGALAGGLALALEGEEPSLLTETPVPARRPPPLPPVSLPAPVRREPEVLASVRIDASGAVRSSFGSDERLAALVAYLSRVATLVQADFGLDPFDALHAELAGKRLLIYRERDELVGKLLKPGRACQQLRHELGL